MISYELFMPADAPPFALSGNSLAFGLPVITTLAA
jgi:hypothetical protein